MTASAKTLRAMIRIRTAPELARMFWTPSKFGPPMVDGLALLPEECQIIATALAAALKRKRTGRRVR